MLESYQHAASFFATLTYSEETYPENGSVSVREAQLFLKRLRRDIAPQRLRYFVVGEYGEQTKRAHYHAALFGLLEPDAVSRAWTAGHVHVVPLTAELAQYLVGYVVKGLTKDETKLAGRSPEFARMSLRPGIGAGAVGQIRDALIDSDGVVRVLGDVPCSVRWGGRFWPVGRYLRSKLRERVGGDVESVRAMRALESAEALRSVSAREEREEKRVQDGRSARARAAISKSKREL